MQIRSGDQYQALYLSPQLFTTFRIITISDGLNEQIFKTLLVKHLIQNVDYTAPLRLRAQSQTFEETVENAALARFAGEHIPKVADVRLADTTSST